MKAFAFLLTGVPQHSVEGSLKFGAGSVRRSAGFPLGDGAGVNTDVVGELPDAQP